MNYEEMYDLTQEINDLTSTKVDEFTLESAQKCAHLLSRLVASCTQYVQEIAKAHNTSVEIIFSHTILSRDEDYEYEMIGPFFKIGNTEVTTDNFKDFIKPECEHAMQCVEDLFIILDDNQILIPSDLEITVTDTSTKTKFQPLIREYRTIKI